MNKIRTGDEVLVIAGKDTGKRGKVLRFAGSEKVVVEGINRAKKHVKPNPVKGISGGVIDKDMPIHLSNVALFQTGSLKAERVGFRILDDGKKVRVFRSNGEAVGV